MYKMSRNISDVESTKQVFKVIFAFLTAILAIGAISSIRKKF